MEEKQILLLKIFFQAYVFLKIYMISKYCKKNVQNLEYFPRKNIVEVLRQETLYIDIFFLKSTQNQHCFLQ